MPEFTFTARDREGAPQSGTRSASDASSLADTLRRRGWVVTGIRPVVDHAGSLPRLASLAPSHWLPVRSIDVEVSLQQIATMLRSGLTLLGALDVVVRQSPRRSMAEVWRRVSRRVQEGSSLSDAMAQQRRFGRLVVQLVRVGEQTGTLDAVLARAADAMETRRSLRSGLLTAMIYPAIVLVMATGVTSFLVLSVIPKLSVALTSLGTRLPAITQSLMDVSAWVRAELGTLATLAIAVPVAVVVVYLWPPGRMALDRWILRVPVIGRLLRLAATAAFSHTMSVLLRSGITVLDGLQAAGDLHHNRYLAAQVGAARRHVLEGGSLAEPLAIRGAYMPMLASMVGVGESAGTLDETLSEVARFHEKQLQSAIKRLGTLIEPVIIVVVGSIVGYVYIAFFVALFSAAGGPH